MCSPMSRACIANLNRMNEENAFDNEESGTNKSQRDGVLSTDRACGSRTMNEENASDNKESGTNKSRRYGVSFLCGGFVFVLNGCCVVWGFVVVSLSCARWFHVHALRIK
jgi:hypothetical protein